MVPASAQPTGRRCRATSSGVAAAGRVVGVRVLWGGPTSCVFREERPPVSRVYQRYYRDVCDEYIFEGRQGTCSAADVGAVVYVCRAAWADELP